MKPAVLSERVLLTGSEGFTGKHLRQNLENAGYEVYGTTWRDTEHSREFSCDIRNVSSLEEILNQVKPDYIVHLAGLAFTAEENAAALYEINALGSENLLKAALRLSKKPKKILLASSATVYGDQKTDVLQESMCPRPVQHYGISKLAMERIAQTYMDRLPIMIVRPFNYTGPGQDMRFVVPKIVDHFRRRASFIELGNLDVYREFNDVRYVAECYRRLLSSPVSSEIVNLASDRPIALRELLETLEGITGHRLEVRVNPKFVRANEIPRLSGATARLSRIIDLPRNYSLEETLRWMLAESSGGNETYGRFVGTKG